MSSRRGPVALLLLVAMTAIGLSGPGVLGSGTGTSAPAEAGATFAVLGARVDSPLAEGKRRNTDQALKLRLVFAAVLAALRGRLFVTSRWRVVDATAHRQALSWWSSRAGRSPPSFGSAVA